MIFFLMRTKYKLIIHEHFILKYLQNQNNSSNPLITEATYNMLLQTDNPSTTSYYWQSMPTYI